MWESPSPVQELASWMTQRAVMTDLVRQHLLRAQSRMKKQADLHRSEREFQVGDRVYVKLQPYVQTSVARRANQKLDFRSLSHRRTYWFCRLSQMPEYSSIHPVIQVSQLKKSPGSCPVSPDLPDDLAEFRYPDKLLQSRWSTGDRPVRQVLVQWSGSPPALATWELGE